MKTCCDQDLIAENGNHTIDFDHIIFNSNKIVNIHNAESLNRPGANIIIPKGFNNKKMSDHLAKAAILQLKFK